MSSVPKPKATEERLDEIRRNATEGGKPASIPGAESYYGLPVLKAPTWTWEVPLYFFLGGISGMSACIGFAAQLFHAGPELVRVCLWMGLVAAGLCPPLLISDLGRPSRFLNMLRVFKLKSPMSMGSWILIGFSGFSFFSVVGIELVVRGIANPYSSALLWAAAGFGAAMGLLLSSYTGVLIGATAIPVWSQNRELIPGHFLTSGLGGASAVLELFGFLIPVTQIIGFAVASIETVLELFLEIRKKPVDGPLHHGRSGITLRIAGALEGPAALLIRIFMGSHAGGRQAAAICFLVGALMSRYGWIWAGRASAHDPHALFALQRGKSASA